MTTRTRKATAAKATETVAPQRIPAGMMATGFVAVALRFPEAATAHRLAYVAYVAGVAVQDDTTPAVAWNAAVRTETRAACQATADTVDRVYELSAPMAHHRGAVACPDPACFGGAQ